MTRINWARMTLAEKQRRLVDDRSYLDILGNIYKWRARRELYYIQEHPQLAESWMATCVNGLI